MSKLNPNKLNVEFRDGVTETTPIIPRFYTLTHSDITAELFLTIGFDYAYDQITVMRDEVLGKWIQIEMSYQYHAFLYVDGGLSSSVTAMRDFIFRKEMPLALEAIRYGDRQLFDTYKELDDSPILVHFISANPDFNKVENWGTFSEYKI